MTATAEAAAPKETMHQRTDKGYSRAFTTAPKIRRHNSDAAPTRKRAQYLMEQLFQNGFNIEAPYDAVLRFVVEKSDFIGLQRRTIEQYIGRPRKLLKENENFKTELRLRYPRTGTVTSKEITAVKVLPEREGICQQLGYMKFDYRQGRPFLILNHDNVPLPYHLKQVVLDSEKGEGFEESKDGLRASPIGSLQVNREANTETIERELRERRDSKGSARVLSKDLGTSLTSLTLTSLTLTPLEKRILKASSERREHHGKRTA